MKIRGATNLLEINTPAKVNLYLDILGRREDGFHEIDTVMAKVSLYDTLVFRPRTDSEISISLQETKIRSPEEPSIPTGPDNLIAKACEALRASQSRTRPGKLCGIDVTLIKRIPSAAGLGGASSNAAAALLAANKIWKLERSAEQLEQIAGELGSDIPFFLRAGSARCTGRGEVIEPLPSIGGMAMVIAKPPVGLATAEVYREYSKLLESTAGQGGNAPSTTKQWRRRMTQSPRDISKHLYNTMQRCAAQMTSWIGKLKDVFRRTDGCLGHQMSGSGSSYFGIFANHLTARRAAVRLSNQHPSLTISSCTTLGSLGNQSFHSQLAGERSFPWK